MTSTLQPTAENQWTTSPQSTSVDSLEKVRGLLNSVTYCSLSTCDGKGTPWVSPVFFAFDTVLNLYWSSAIASRHSQNLYTNQGKAAIALYQSQRSEAPTDGLYFTGIATELDLASAQHAFSLLEERSGKLIPRSPADYVGQSVRRMYRFSPQKAWCTGERLPHGNQLIDTKILLNIKMLQANL